MASACGVQEGAGEKVDEFAGNTRSHWRSQQEVWLG